MSCYLGNPLVRDAQTACALLDPDAIRCTPSSDTMPWSPITVPAGQTWWMLNGWFLEAPGDPAHYFFHRPLCVSQAVPLPAGTTLSKWGQASRGFVVWCDPSLATQHPDPEVKLAQRLERIATLPRKSLTVDVPAGMPQGWFDFKVLPAEVQKYIVIGVVVENVPWAILKHGEKKHGCNTTCELDDVRNLRNSQRVIFAGKRDLYDRVRVRGGSPSGTGTSVAGQGGIVYLDLTNVADW